MSEQLPTHGEWRMLMFCTHCEEHLTHREFHDHGGACCHCGRLGRHGILPDVVQKSARPVYTDGRRLAIKAQKIRNSNVVVRFFARFFPTHKKDRPFVWEYHEYEVSDR